MTQLNNTPMKVTKSTKGRILRSNFTNDATSTALWITVTAIACCYSFLVPGTQAFAPTSTIQVLNYVHSSPQQQTQDLFLIPFPQQQQQHQQQQLVLLTTTSLGMVGFLPRDNSGGGKDNNDDDEEDDEDEDDDEDEEDEDDEDEDSLTSSRRRSSSKLFSKLKLDPNDPNPPIKPRPGRFGFGSLEEEMRPVVPDAQLVQTMTPSERAENLKIMRQIKKSDLVDLRMRKDHAGWMEANADLKRRTYADPWFGLNDRMKDAYSINDEAEMIYLQKLTDQVGGPPPGVTVGPRGYAEYTDIYDVGVSASRAASMLDQQILEQRIARGRAMAAERRKNLQKEQREWEDAMRNPGDKEDREAKERRERTMRRIMGEIEEETKKKQERAKEILGQIPEGPKDSRSSLDKALQEATEDVKRLRRLRKEGRGLGEVSEDADLTFMNPEDRMELERGRSDAAASSNASNKVTGAAAKAREQAEAQASGGRPRLPGDEDVTRGEIEMPTLNSSSATTGPLTVQVTSSYNTEQSEPPMRKHCFQYTVRITNNSKDTVQLLSRRFEIQTVGSSTKDVVQGEGVTGRQPILKPGEVFEYTSTAPLSVRPLGTTIIAARMRGEYRYVVLKDGQGTATQEQVKAGGDGGAELGVFHFVFPEEQRVKSYRQSASENDDDEDEDEDDEDDKTSAKSSSVSKASSTASPKSSAAVAKPPTTPSTVSPASTIPGDSDMHSGDLASASISDTSNTLANGIRVQVASTYRPERSDASMDRHCFAYNVRITNESPQPIQLVSRRFEIQTIGSSVKDVVQGPGVTGRQPILQPGESFEYTSTAPLSVKPMMSKTLVVARMEGEYSLVKLGGGPDGSAPTSSTPLQAKMGRFHFILPATMGK